MIFGWGRRSRRWAMTEGWSVACVYRCFRLFFVFSWAYDMQWVLIDPQKQSRPVQRGEVEALYPDGGAPNLSAWDRFGLVVGIAAFVVLAMLMNVGSAH